MTKPAAASGYPLGSKEIGLLRGLTGNEYERAYPCGKEPDGIICLANGDDIEILGCADGDRYGAEKCELLSIGPNAKPDAGREIAPSNPRYGFLTGLVSTIERQSCQDNIDFIPREEPKSKQLWRMEKFMRLHDRLTQGLAKYVSVVDFRTTSGVGGYASGWQSVGYIRVGKNDFEFEHYTIHEVAHMRTYNLPKGQIQKWEGIAGSLYLGDEWEKNPKMTQEINPDDQYSDGIISWYAYKNADEDISELTAFVYSAPGYVRYAASLSPIVGEKVRWLFENEYISMAQYEEVTQPYSKEALAKLGEMDVLGILGKMDVDPCRVNKEVRESPVLAGQIRFLHDNKFITEAQYRYLTSADPEDEIAQPMCAEDRTFVEGVQYYLDRIFRLLAASPPLSSC